MKSKLQQYAAFVRSERLEEYVSKELQYLQRFDVPIMNFFKHLKPEELKELSIQGATKLLAGIENGTAIDEVKISLDNWRDDKLPGIPRTAISIKDLTLIYSIQKLSLLELLPDFTNDNLVANKLVTELELHYITIQEMAVEMLEAIRQEEQEKFIESEQRFKDLFHNSNDLMQFVSAEGKILFTNTAWKNTLGYSDDDFATKTIYELIDENDLDVYVTNRDKILSQELSSCFLRTSFKTKNKGRITLEGYISSKVKDGKIEYTQGIWRDITERLLQENRIKTINDQLTEKEEDLRHLVHNAPDAVILIDQSNNVLLWNKRAEEIFGWKQEEVINKDLSDLIIPATHKDAHRNGMLRLTTTGKSTILNTTVEVPAIDKKGNELVISITISTTRQAGKQAFIGFLRDITAQKKNELELDNQRKQLQKTNQELEQYAWLASHDLKEPVRKILTFSDALLKQKNENISTSQSNYLNKIHDSATRMNALIEAVLQYSNIRNEANLFELTDLTATLNEVLDDLEILINSNLAVINIEKLPVINANPVQMRQLFQNIITNALKYRKREEAPVINITCTRINEGYQIKIADNGIGFENSFSEKIFQVFQRLVPGQDYEGTGIGLSLAKKIVETHNGSIYAESNPGIGSTFFIILPLNPVMPLAL